MPISRLELAEFGRFVSGKYRFLKRADFEAYPRTQSINQPLKNIRVRRLWGKHGVRRLWGISSYMAYSYIHDLSFISYPNMLFMYIKVYYGHEKKPEEQKICRYIPRNAYA